MMDVFLPAKTVIVSHSLVIQPNYFDDQDHIKFDPERKTLLCGISCNKKWFVCIYFCSILLILQLI